MPRYHGQPLNHSFHFTVRLEDTDYEIMSSSIECSDIVIWCSFTKMTDFIRKMKKSKKKACDTAVSHAK